jgi:DNA-binding NarL/FixJ family response regulator
MELIAEGHVNSSIGHQLGITEGTVKRYVSRIFEKLHFTSRVDLAAAIWKQKHEAEIAKLHEYYSTIDMRSN